MQRHDPDGSRLPIKIDTTTNGEFAPAPLDAVSEEANRAAHQKVGDAAKKIGMGRRAYLVSTCGAAATLTAMNETFAAAGLIGGKYAVPKESAFDLAAADSVLSGDEFIMDVQLHCVNPTGTWRHNAPSWDSAYSNFARQHIAQGICEVTGGNEMQCLDGARLVKDVFMDSDTTVAVLSSVPSAPDNPLHTWEAAVVRSLAEAAGGRLLIHGLCHANFPGHIERIQYLHETYNLAGLKVYPQWGPGSADGKGGIGFYLDDEDTGIRMIEEARRLGLRNICMHKGFPLADLTYEFSSCRDVGVVARRYPDMNFMVYHSGFETATAEGPYDPNMTKGVNSLIHTLLENGVKPGSNVYAELGSTWRYIMRNPEQAAHILGKLLKYVGEDNILWGTDCIWYGSPQDQIQAFRAFAISEEFQDKYGYPALTPERKRKILGLNAARAYGINPQEVKKKAESDRWGRSRAEYVQEKDPSFLTYGPKTRREFMSLLRENGGSPH